MRTTSRLGRRITAVLAAGVLAAGIAAVSGIATPAQAAPSLGTLTIAPATGNESTALSGTTSAACPAGSTGINGYMSGPNMTEANGILLSNRPPATDFTFSSLFKELFTANAIAAPSGAYTVRIACIGPDFFAEVGEFTQVVNFTPRGGANNANYVTVVPGATTTTTLAAPTPADPVTLGTGATLNATVDGGTAGTPTGSIQFKGGSAGTTNIGSPVAMVDGAASLTTAAIPAGTNALKATYVPSGANALDASTSSAISYVVAGPATITGTARVGYTITCTSVATAGATKAFVWTVGTATSAVTAGSVKVPATWAKKSVKCAINTTKNAKTVTQTSATKTIALGVAPKAVRKPYLSGIFKVGKKLTCNKGTWSPTPSSYKYQWYRGSTKLTGKTLSTYVTSRYDKGKYVTCQVTAIKSGYLNGVAKAAPKKIL